MNYRNLAYQAAQKYGLDPDMFVRQIQAESAFNPAAVSSAGAIGLGQLMPATAKELGVDPTDPVQNLEGAARYMRQQLDRFGDPALALAAYNAGPSRVAKANGIPKITETQNYVAKILGGKGGASMADQPTQPQQSQGLLGGILGGQGIGGALGLSDDFRDRLKMGLLLGSDPRAFAPMVAGIQARGKERRAEAKEQRQRNKSLEFLRQRADAGDALAQQYYEAASTGVLPVGAGIAGYLEQMTKVPKTSEKERSIQRLVDTGMDRNTATLITEGVLVTSRDPVTGNAVVINKATGATVGQLPSSVADAVAEAEPAAGDGGAFEGLDISSALGVRGWTSSILNKVTDAVGAGQVAGEAGEVEAALDNLKARTILMSGIDVEGKPSNFTRQIIEQKFTISPSELSTGPVAALQRATEMVDMLEQTLSAVEIAAGGGGGASAQQVKEARASRSGIESLLADYRSLKNALEKKGVSSGAANGQPTVVQTDQDRALIQKWGDPNYYRDNMLPSPE